MIQSKEKKMFKHIKSEIKIRKSPKFISKILYK